MIIGVYSMDASILILGMFEQFVKSSEGAIQLMLFDDMGMNMTTALTIFVKAVVKQGKIPFEITADPFYNEANQAYLKKAINALNAGQGQNHELIEVSDE